MKQIVILFFLSILVFSCQDQVTVEVEDGISFQLAQERKANIKDISYHLTFDIPESPEQGIPSELILGVKLTALDKDLILDFSADSELLKAIEVNDQSVEIYHSHQHLIIPKASLKKGYNEIKIDFIAGDAALNRNEEYLYALFVPSKASSTFPCFDQPNLKARFSLNLILPQGWNYMANSPLLEQETRGDKIFYQFKESALLSTYLFSFVAGDFEHVELNSGGFEMELLHRESEDARLEQNLDEIVDLHQQAIKWLESYTGIAYPYEKFGVAVLPGFQFGGMEHPGVVHYRSSLLMLEESATLQDRLNRAGLIAHETAHMWFGNWVTMEWFDDVWMKEVFANFMADKIVKEMFPDVNHDLAFLYDHYPAAYAVDRTEGSTPIRQHLDNLKDAANMYGSIIYHKAPIMMRQLEWKIGEKRLQSALQEYLENYGESNADWEDLIEIIQRVSAQDLSQFNQSWVYESGMPYFELTEFRTETQFEFDLIQHDPKGKGRVWPQVVDVAFTDEYGTVTQQVTLDKQHYIFPQLAGRDDTKFVLLNSSGKGYGVFSHGLGYIKDEFLFNKARVDISRYDDVLVRGAAYINLHEYLLQEGFHPEMYFYFLQNYLKEETNEQIVQYLLRVMQQVYFRFFTQEMRMSNAGGVESILLNKLEKTESVPLKSALFNAYIAMAQSSDGIAKLRTFWKGDSLPEGVSISSRQEESLALEIALKGNPEDETIIDEQINRMTNQDRIKRLNFIRPAVSSGSSVRRRFFESLKEEKNRVQEPWVITALSYLHHPVRQEASIDYLMPSLELLPELQRTGDIFFTKRWLDETLYGYQSTEAADIVRQYLEDNELNYHLKNKVLQSSDMLFRSEKMLNDYLSSD
ncbi:M1 family metallopeptidase [Reichenbachiella ulvae]|uniref:Aminopeptidase N n=1 Tax=Reichenbachiella ulvae TaxID=2980104 RepID=A0ABT3CR44_9BACT|nr:M1 family aminopeptidase [Reichenbachiella ulvae]MCV9386166.1 M1 family aminopeptidase [Reichenbachiella ulvae]